MVQAQLHVALEGERAVAANERDDLKMERRHRHGCSHLECGDLSPLSPLLVGESPLEEWKAATSRRTPNYLALFYLLRVFGEHLDNVIMHAIVELPLKRPGELRMIQVARMHLVIVGVQAQRLVPEIDDDLDRVVAV